MSNFNCRRRSKTSTCHGVENRNLQQAGGSCRVAFTGLTDGLERELRRSEKTLNAANNYLGSSSRMCQAPVKKYVSQNTIKGGMAPETVDPSCQRSCTSRVTKTRLNQEGSRLPIHSYGGRQQSENPCRRYPQRQRDCLIAPQYGPNDLMNDVWFNTHYNRQVNAQVNQVDNCQQEQVNQVDDCQEDQDDQDDDCEQDQDDDCQEDQDDDCQEDQDDQDDDDQEDDVEDSQCDHHQCVHHQHDHSTLDHSTLDHSTLDHSKHDHSKHDHSKHDHSKHDHSKHDHSKHDHHQHDHQNGLHGSHQESHSDLLQLTPRAIESINHLSKIRKSSLHQICELEKGCEVFDICFTKKKDEKKTRCKRLPKPPILVKEHLEELISCETKDVESALYLTSEERKTYKKPCPKQMKAQMGVKSLVERLNKPKTVCERQYSKLEHPEPEDISPDVAAAMMFLQEEGLKLNECPDFTITRLFPKDPRPPLPEKESVSIVNPNEEDQQRMMERSASVPSDGVSDSAYTRRMAGRVNTPEQKSYDLDFAIGASKREYVFVAEKPERVNVVRFRGGSTPLWFPWYFSAFPDDKGGGLKVSPSPSGLFYKAWLFSNPENLPANDVIVLD